jgi:hypothetical protein
VSENRPHIKYPHIVKDDLLVQRNDLITIILSEEKKTRVNTRLDVHSLVGGSCEAGCTPAISGGNGMPP